LTDQKTLKDFPNDLKPLSIGFDILDLIDILRKYNVPQKTSKAYIRFYYGLPL